MTKPVTPANFDALAVGPPRKVWGAPAIARVLGVSVDTVYALARDPKSPVYKPKGYFAFRHELEAWMRTKPEPLLSREKRGSVGAQEDLG